MKRYRRIATVLCALMFITSIRIPAAAEETVNETEVLEEIAEITTEEVVYEDEAQEDVLEEILEEESDIPDDAEYKYKKIDFDTTNKEGIFFLYAESAYDEIKLKLNTSYDRSTRFYYKKNDIGYWKSISIKKINTDNEMVVNGLEPDTSYDFAIVNGSMRPDSSNTLDQKTVKTEKYPVKVEITQTSVGNDKAVITVHISQYSGKADAVIVRVSYEDIFGGSCSVRGKKERDGENTSYLTEEEAKNGDDLTITLNDLKAGQTYNNLNVSVGEGILTSKGFVRSPKYYTKESLPEFTTTDKSGLADNDLIIGDIIEGKDEHNKSTSSVAVVPISISKAGSFAAMLVHCRKGEDDYIGHGFADDPQSRITNTVKNVDVDDLNADTDYEFYLAVEGHIAKKTFKTGKENVIYSEIPDNAIISFKDGIAINSVSILGPTDTLPKNQVYYISVLAKLSQDGDWDDEQYLFTNRNSRYLYKDNNWKQSNIIFKYDEEYFSGYEEITDGKDIYYRIAVKRMPLLKEGVDYYYDEEEDEYIYLDYDEDEEKEIYTKYITLKASSDAEPEFSEKPVLSMKFKDGAKTELAYNKGKGVISAKMIRESYLDFTGVNAEDITLSVLNEDGEEDENETDDLNSDTGLVNPGKYTIRAKHKDISERPTITITITKANPDGILSFNAGAKVSNKTAEVTVDGYYEQTGTQKIILRAMAGRAEKFDTDVPAVVADLSDAAAAVFDNKLLVNVNEDYILISYDFKSTAKDHIGDGKFSFKVTLQNYEDVTVNVTIAETANSDDPSDYTEAPSSVGAKWAGRLAADISSGEIEYLGRALTARDIVFDDSDKEITGKNIIFYMREGTGESAVLSRLKGISNVQYPGDYKVVALFTYTGTQETKNYRYSKEFTIKRQSKLSKAVGGAVEIPYENIKDGTFSLTETELAKMLTYGKSSQNGGAVNSADIKIWEVKNSNPYSFRYEQNPTKVSVLPDNAKSVVNLSEGADSTQYYKDQPYVLITDAGRGYIDGPIMIAFDIAPEVKKGDGADQIQTANVRFVTKSKNSSGNLISNWVATKKVASGKTVDLKDITATGINSWVNEATGKVWNFATDIVNEDITLIGMVVTNDTGISVEGMSDKFTVEGIPDQVYTGKAIKPAVVVTNDNDGTVLKKGKNLKITYPTAINAKANNEIQLEIYGTSRTVKFDIVQADFNDVVGLPDKQLILNNRGEVSLSVVKSIKVGKATAKLAKGDYTCWAENCADTANPKNKIEAGTNGKFKFTKAGVYDVIIEAANDKGEYTGNFANDTSFRVYVADKKYHLTKATIKGAGNKKLASKELSSNTLDMMQALSVKMGDGKTAEYKYDADEEQWVWDNDLGLNVEFTGLDKVGKATVTISAEEDSEYYGAKVATYKITKPKAEKQITSAKTKKLKAKLTAQKYKGSGWTVEEILGDNAKITIESVIGKGYGKDYVAVYKKNTNPGTATVTFKAVDGSGLYGSGSVTFKIDKRDMVNELKDNTKPGVTTSAIKVDSSGKWVVSKADFVLNESTQKYILKNEASLFTDSYRNNYVLEKDKDYTVTYSNNQTLSDKTKVTIKAKGGYTKNLSVKIDPSTL